MKKIVSVIIALLLLSGVAFGASQTFQGSVSGNAATVTTNANLTGDVTSVGNATTIKEAPTVKAITLNLGSELATNYDFSAGDSGWTKEAGWTIAGTPYKAVATDCANLNNVYQTVTGLTAGGVYLLTVVVSDFTDGTVHAYSNGTPTEVGPLMAGTGTASGLFVATGTSHVIGASIRTAGSDLKISSISLKRIPSVVNGDIYATGNARVVIPTFANNAAAVAGGLVAGQLYRVNAATDPEPLFIVH